MVVRVTALRRYRVTVVTRWASQLAYASQLRSFVLNKNVMWPPHLLGSVRFFDFYTRFPLTAGYPATKFLFPSIVREEAP